MTQRYTIWLFDGFSNHCLANMVEPLRAANTLSSQELYEWRFCTLDGAPVQSSSGLEVVPHGSIADQVGDVLVVMPSYGFLDFDTRAITHALFLVSKKHFKLAGLDMGSWLLARAGLLDEQQCTIHWDELSRFEETFPNINVVKERFVIDGNRLTCSGAMAAFDLALTLIRDRHGMLLSIEVAQLLMDHGVANQHHVALRSQDSLVNRAIEIMQQNLENPLSIRQLAQALGCSQKRIERRVRAHLETTPQSLYRRLRLNMARKLAEDAGQSVAEIASRCGYENAGAMTRAFKSEFGQTPSAYRGGAPLRK